MAEGERAVYTRRKFNPSAKEDKSFQCDVRSAAFCGTGSSQGNDVNYNADDSTNHSLRLGLSLQTSTKKTWND